MTKISYFQRFSQKENHATNNTLLIMRHFYKASPRKISTVLSDLANDDLSIGLVFGQQIRLSDSVPDALISQAPLDIYIETKRGGQLDREQIKRHIGSIGNSSTVQSQTILFGLTRHAIEKNVRDELVKEAKIKKIIFVPITFADVVRALRSVCESHETALHEILSDYEDYLKVENLLQNGEVLSVFPCGTSMNENIEYRLYFEPPERPSKAESKFIGLYNRKRISHLASIKTVVTGVEGTDGFIVRDTERGELSDQERERIKGAIAHCVYYPDLSQKEHRYYLFDEIYETRFVKSSKYGLLNRRDLYLSHWLDYDEKKEYSAQETAEGLRGQEFE